MKAKASTNKYVGIIDCSNHHMVQDFRSRFISYSLNFNVIIVIAVYAILAYPVIRANLEQSMLTHMLVQIPLLVICGAWITNYVLKKSQFKLAFEYALPVLIISLTAAMYWMLPRTLDATLEYFGFEIAKFITLPVLIGSLFALGWRNVGAITKAFVITNLLSMLIVIGWLYIEAPIRLCNYYLLNEQKLVGSTILFITFIFSIYCITSLFIGKVKR